MQRNATVIVKVELWRKVIFVQYNNAPARFVSYKKVPVYLIRPLTNCNLYHSPSSLEIALAEKQVVRNFNDYKQIWMMCLKNGWSWSIDENGYTIQGLYSSGWNWGLDLAIKNRLAAMSLAT